MLKKLRNLRRGSVPGPIFSQKAATPLGPIGLVASEKCSSRSQSENLRVETPQTSGEAPRCVRARPLPRGRLPRGGKGAHFVRAPLAARVDEARRADDHALHLPAAPRRLGALVRRGEQARAGRLCSTPSSCRARGRARGRCLHARRRRGRVASETEATQRLGRLDVAMHSWRLRGDGGGGGENTASSVARPPSERTRRQSPASLV